MNLKESVLNLTKFEKILWLSSFITLTGVFMIAGNRDWLSLIASLIGITALVFVAKGDTLGQVLTIVFSMLYAVISYRFRYFGEMITYLGMTAPIALLSTITWLRNPYTKQEVKVNQLKLVSWFLLMILTGVVTYIFYFILKAYHTPNLMFSTISIATSFAASSLMMLRSPYYAVAYALNDIILIILWIFATSTDIVYLPMVVCFIIFLINDIYGFLNWNTMKGKQQTRVLE